MQLYFAYVNPKTQDIKYLREQNFSVIAALFNIFWACYHKLWGVALVAFLITILLNIPDADYLSDEIMIALKLALSLIFGFFANDLHQYTLYRRGYVLDDIILSNSELEAQKEYLIRNN